jgi:hypothetical protein
MLKGIMQPKDGGNGRLQSSVLKGEHPPRLLNPDVVAVRPLAQVKMLH